VGEYGVLLVSDERDSLGDHLRVIARTHRCTVYLHKLLTTFVSTGLGTGELPHILSDLLTTFVLLQGRRKSLSTGNLRSDVEAFGEKEFLEGEVYEDEIDVSGSGINRTNTEDFDSSEIDIENAPDYASLSFERPKIQRKIRFIFRSYT